MNTTESIEQIKAAQEERIQRTKIYGDGTTAIPQGIVDILFVNTQTGVIKRFSGDETENGRVLILLPFRTPRNLSKYASYSQPSEWKLKFSKGMMVNAVIEDGYIKKLIPSHQYMPAAATILPEDLNDDEPILEVSDRERSESNSARVKAFENDSYHSNSVPAGFDDNDDVPF